MLTSNDYYLEQLRDQVNFLIDACHAYDRGYFVYAKQMSGIIRTLLKDNPKNKQTISLLKSLGIKETMKFYNTAYSARDPKILLNLVGFFREYKPCLAIKEIPIYVPMFDDTGLVDVPWIDFDDWWESDVIVCKDVENDFSLSRKQIILAMAEQDGGVHVDKFEKMDSVYKGIITNTANILTHYSPSGDAVAINYLQYALVRQISHEVITSLYNVYDTFKPYNPTLEWILQGYPKEKIRRPFMISFNDGDLSKRTDRPLSGDRGTAIVAPPGTAYIRLEIK